MTIPYDLFFADNAPTAPYIRAMPANDDIDSHDVIVRIASWRAEEHPDLPQSLRPTRSLSDYTMCEISCWDMLVYYDGQICSPFSD